MEQKKLGEHEVIKRNYEYLLLAQQNGFFQDGYYKDDIATCSDWVVTWWVDELGEKKEDKQKFVEEILPNFKRWFSDGVNSTGVGSYYDILKLAERNGIKIDNDSFSCIISILFSKSLTFNNQYSNYQDISNYFEVKEIFDNLIKFNKNGIPITYPLSRCYDCLVALEEKGESVNFDSFTFFYTSGYQTFDQDMDLYEDKKRIEEKYGYSTCNADEIKKLNDWLGYGGYNSNYIRELRDKIQKWEKTISSNKSLDKGKERIQRKINKKVTVTYFSLDENGNSEIHKVSGILVNCDDNSITINVQNPENGTLEGITINDNDKNIISSVNSDAITLYKCRTLKERTLVHNTKLRVKEIKGENIVSKYTKKYGTIEGLAYLKKFAPQFIESVNKDQFPIDNLFAFCFENIAWISAGNVSNNDVLRQVLYTYNSIMSGKYEVLKDTNFGYPLNKFLSDETQKYVKRICAYVISEELKADLPGTQVQPTTPIVAIDDGAKDLSSSQENYYGSEEHTTGKVM